MTDGTNGGCAVGLPEYGAAGHKHVRAGLYAERGRVFIDTAVNLQITARSILRKELPDALDLRELVFHKALPAKPRLNRHDQHKIHAVDKRQDRLGRSVYCKMPR